MKQQFYKAADAALKDPKLQQKPVLHIETETFRQIFRPIRRILEADPVYRGKNITISTQIEELRRMCLEAQAAHTTTDQCTKKRRTQLINALQGLLEKVREVENA